MGSAAQQYCLRWNNHRSNLLTVFDQLLQNEAFTDVTLACEGASIKCHRMVLAACSSYFRSLFTDLSCRHLVVVLKDVGYPEIKAILEYMYRGEVNVAQDQLGALLRVAETLKVKGLVEENVRADSPPPSHHHHHHSPPSAVTTSVSSVPPNLSPPRAPAMTTVSHAHTYVPSPPSTPGLPGSSAGRGQRPVVGLSPWALPPGAHRPQHHPHHAHPLQSHLHHPHSLIQHGTLPPPSTHHHHPCPPPPPSSSHLQHQQEATAAASADREEAGDLSSSPKRRRPSGDAIQRFPSPPPPPPQRRDTPILRTVLGQSHHPGMQRPVALLSSGHSSHDGDGGDGADSSQPAQRPVSLVCRHGSSPDRESSNGSASESVRIMKYEQSYEDDHSPYTNISNTDDETYSDKKNVMMLPGSTQPTFSGEMKGITSGIATYVPTQKPEWKRYKQYTRSDIMSAIEAVRTGMSALQAARKYGVPSRTLYDKVKKLGITTSRPFKRSSAPMSLHQGGNSNESLSKPTTPTPLPSSQQPPPPTTPNSSPNEGDPDTPPEVGGGQEGSGEGSSVDGGMDESQPPQIHCMSSHPHLHFAPAPSSAVGHQQQQRHSPPPPTNAAASLPPPPTTTTTLHHHHHRHSPPMEVVNDVPEPPRGSVVTAVPRHVEDGDMNDVGRPSSREAAVGPSCIASPQPAAAYRGGADIKREEEEGEEEEEAEEGGGEDEVEDLSVGGRHREVGSVVAFVPGDGSRREGVVVKAERMEEGRVGGPVGKNEEVMD